MILIVLQGNCQCKLLALIRLIYEPLFWKWWAN